MKLSQLHTATLSAFVLAVGLSGCANKNLKDESAKTSDATTTQPDTKGADTNKVTPPVAATGTALTQSQASSQTSTQANEGLKSIGAPDQRSVYFDFDKYVIRPEFNSLIDDHGKFINANKDRKMLIQGNADERGSREYNLALGQRRSDTVKRALLLQGVKEEQIESVSLGEEKPKAPGHDEASWAENRRADMLYKGEY